jgi:hypothetical protein
MLTKVLKPTARGHVVSVRECELRRLRKQRYRRRQQRGQIVVRVTVSHALLNFLIDIGHLSCGEAENRERIADAVVSALSSAMGTRGQT